MNLDSLRHSAKEILAVATLELFPSVQLVGGGVDEIGFHYDFLFPKKILTVFSESELHHLEDQMIRIVHENRPIKELEMMRENSATYLEHLGQTLRAEKVLNLGTNIISVIEIGPFRDPCPGPYLTETGALKAFKLQGFQADEVVRIYGTAFFERKELKTFLKQYKEATKRDPSVIGLKEGYFLPVEGEWIYLAKGEHLLQKLKNFWDQEHIDFERLTFPDALDRDVVHESVMQKKKFTRIASFSLSEGDYISIKCTNEQELFEVLISSLHFMEKAFKIFAFESRIYCVEPRSSWLSDVLKQAGFVFEHELSTEGEVYIAFRVVDRYGREKTLSCLEVERNKNVLHSYLFRSPKRWVAHMIEMGVEN